MKVSNVGQIRLSNAQVAADYFDQVLGGIVTGLAITGHVISDMVFHKLRHETVDPSSCSRQPLEHIRAVRVIIQDTQHRFKLTDNLLGSVYQVQFFSREM